MFFKEKKDDSITFDWKRARNDKCLNNNLILMSKRYKMTTLDDLGKQDYQATMNCRIPLGEPRSTSKQSP